MGYLAQVPVALVFVPLALLGLFGGVLSLVAISILISTTTVGWSRWLIRRRLIAGLPHAQGRTVRWTFTDEGFQVQTAAKTRQVPWTAIRRVLVDPDFWFLQVHDGPELLLPAVHLSAEVRNLICKRAAVLPPVSLQRSHACNDPGAGVVGAADGHGRFQSLPLESPWEPLPERATLEGVRPEGARKRLAGKGWFSRIVWVLISIAGTMFFLQETNLVDGHAVDGRLLGMVAVALGAAFAMARMIQRVAKKAKEPSEQTKRAR
jgi:hypothetical protein